MTGPEHQEADGSIGVVVVNYGAHRLLAVNLTALDGEPGIRIVVVDNFHSPVERESVMGLSAERGWELVATQRNLGFGDGNNLGAERAIALGCDVVVLLNPDASIDASACRDLARIVRTDPRSLVSPVITRPDGSVWSAGSQVDQRSGRVGKVRGPLVSAPDKWLTGAVLATTRGMWEELDGFAPGYFLYWEDVDISRRCVELGGRLIVAQDVQAVHDPGGTQLDQLRGSGKSPIYYYYNCRNRLLFASRHLSTRSMLSWVWHTPAESAIILSRGGRREVAKSPRALASAVGGSLVGFGIVMKELFRRLTSRSAATTRAPGDAAGSDR